MRTILLKTILLMLMLNGIPFLILAQKNIQKQAENDTKTWKYEIEAVNVGVQGTYLIKVWTYSPSPQVAVEQSKKNAIHGIIFKGFAGKQGVPGEKALASDPNAELTHQDFFDSFFSNGGKYMKFVNLTNDGAIDYLDIIKMGKEFKIGLIVSVNVSELRKDLEDGGIIKSLSSGF